MEDGNRGRRNASRRDAAKTAVEALRQGREAGKKRVFEYEAATEENVYDVVNEDEYAQIAQKRRLEAVDFIEDDDGNYLDMGDDDALFYGDEEGGAAEAEEDEGEDGKKGKKGRKSKLKEADAPGAKERLQKMFLAAAAKQQGQPAAAPKISATDTAHADAMLEDLLADMAAPEEPKADPAPRLMPVAVRPVARPAPAAPSARGASRVIIDIAPADANEAARAAAASAANDYSDYDADAGFGGFDPAPYDTGAMDTDAPEAKPLVSGAASGPNPSAAAAAFSAAAAAALPEPDVMASGWAEILAAAPGVDAPSSATADESRSAPDASLPLTEAGHLPFFFLDAQDDPNNPGTIFLFGKVPVGSPTARQYASCCATIRGLYRSVYVVPSAELFQDEDGAVRALEEEVAKDKTKRGLLARKVMERLAPLRAELASLLDEHGVTKYGILPVKRSYAFEDAHIPHREQWVLKVKYLVLHPETGKLQRPVPLGLKGEHFAAMLGTNQSPLEALLLKRRFAGPGWLALKGAQSVEPSRRISWCKAEVAIGSPKDVLASDRVPQEVARLPAPTLCVAALHIKTHVGAGQAQNEIVTASLVYVQDVPIDAPVSRAEWSAPRRLKHVSVVCRLEGKPFPPGFEAKAREKNGTLSCQPSERALLSYLVARLQQLDPDALVGHNIGGFDLDVLVHRLQTNKIPNWSRIGRLKRSKFPNLAGGGNAFGGGASAGLLACASGRLLLDTYVTARELVHEVDYSLSTLARELLGEHRSDVSASDVARRYAAGAEDLLKLCEMTSQDAWLALALGFHLSALPLSLQLTQLSGSIWNRTLQGQRAQRIEMLLLHDFYRRKFLVPDKLTLKEKAKLAAAEAEDGEDGDEAEAPEAAAAGTGGRRKKAAYAGGLVLEPKKGLYKSYVLMLDFNSLYPSIIQEFNICFTTVERSKDGGMPALPPAPSDFDRLAPLPTVIRGLVQKRRQVKEQIKRESDPVRKQQLDIRQQALKLTANSMYGCLGFSNSRFFARPLAELVTHQGREILQSTVNLVEGTIGMEVIYGDTDSIFINTKTNDLEEARQKGVELKKVLNKRFKLLEMELDGIFRSILLLKKKKYAAIKVEMGPRGERLEHMEQKGLDIVRRDWCPLAKECGNFALDRILGGEDVEVVVSEIHAKLESVRQWLDSLASSWEELRKGLPKFLIFKQLTKRPEDYPDAKNQPHVQVALRRRQQGKREGTNAGDTVPYIICTDLGEGGTAPPPTGGKGLAERAYHIDEVRTSAGRYRPDVDYYLGQQLHPVVSRLCAHLEGTDSSRLASALGLDPSRFRGQGPAARPEDEGFSLDMDEEAAYQECEPLTLRSPAGKPFEFRGVVEMLRRSQEGVSPVAFFCPPSEAPAAPGAPPPAPADSPLDAACFANQVRIRIRALLADFYAGEMCNEDEGLRTRQVSVRRPLDGDMGSAPPLADRATVARMVRAVSKSSVYKSLKHLKFLLDSESVLRRVTKREERSRLEKFLQGPADEALRLALREVERALARSDFGFVRLEGLGLWRPRQAQLAA